MVASYKEISTKNINEKEENTSFGNVEIKPV